MPTGNTKKLLPEHCRTTSWDRHRTLPSQYRSTLLWEEHEKSYYTEKTASVLP